MGGGASLPFGQICAPHPLVRVFLRGKGRLSDWLRHTFLSVVLPSLLFVQIFREMSVLIELSGDYVLVRRAQEGDSHAFSFLVKKHRGSLLRLVSHLTRNSVDADDLVQDTFLRAYRAISGFRGDATFSTWIHRIALNVIKTHYRKQTALISANFGDDSGYDGSYDDLGAQLDFETPESRLACKQTADAVALALEKLPTEFRTALILCQMDGLSYQEIAEKMRCPIGTVRSRIARARETIAGYLLSSGH